MNTPTRPLRAHVGLDWTNGHERHACVQIVGPDNRAFASVRFVQFLDEAEQPRLEPHYHSPRLDTDRPGWQKAFHRLARRVLRKNTPARF